MAEQDCSILNQQPMTFYKNQAQVVYDRLIELETAGAGDVDQYNYLKPDCGDMIETSRRKFFAITAILTADYLT